MLRLCYGFEISRSTSPDTAGERESAAVLVVAVAGARGFGFFLHFRQGIDAPHALQRVLFLNEPNRLAACGVLLIAFPALIPMLDTRMFRMRFLLADHPALAITSSQSGQSDTGRRFLLADHPALAMAVPKQITEPPKAVPAGRPLSHCNKRGGSM